MKFVVRKASEPCTIVETPKISTLKDLKHIQDHYGGHPLVIDFNKDLFNSSDKMPSIVIYDDHLE